MPQILSAAFLILFASAPLLARAETRSFTFSRFDKSVEWNAVQFPEIDITRPEAAATLTMGFANPINSVHPYGRDNSQFRPAILDDLLYESLMLLDPIRETESLYPLIAEAIRYPADFSYVTFEINPIARFQDGSPVTGQDIMFSVEQLQRDNPNLTPLFNQTLAGNEIEPGQIKFWLKGPRQAGRDAIMAIATAKIVKVVPHSPQVLNGIPISFVATGPYRIAQLGTSQLILVKDNFYWGKDLPTRLGFFRFPRVELRTFTDDIAAHTSLVSNTSNYFAEQRTNGLDRTFTDMARRNPQLTLIHQLNAGPGEGFDSFVFNVQRAHLTDIRVRRALLLAFDFNKVNRQLFAGSLNRPFSLLDRGSQAPAGVPSPESETLLRGCGSEVPAEIFGDFGNYGNSRYRRFPDDRLRLLEASRLLQTAGYRLINGRLVNAAGSPLSLMLLLKEKWELPIAAVYRDDLSHLGVDLQLAMAADPSEFSRLVSSGTVDMYSAKESLQTIEGEPSARLYSNQSHLNSVCFDQLLNTLEASTYGTTEYASSAQAIARLHQALDLSIFIGEPRHHDFIFDSRIQVPHTLPYQRVHMYGTFFP